MNKKYHNEHAQVVHELANDLLETGTITEERMEEFDKMCFAKIEKKTHSNVRKLNGRIKINGRSALKKAS